MQGKKPNCVFVNDMPCPVDWERWGDHPTVCVDKDKLEDIDLRFLIGLRVHITSLNNLRARALYTMAKEAGAAMVASVHDNTTFIFDKEMGELHG